MTGPTIDSLDQAARYIAELGSRQGLTDALTRVEGRASPEVAAAIDALRRRARGDRDADVCPQFAVFAELLAGPSSGLDLAAGLSAVTAGLGRSRDLARELRTDRITDIGQPAVLAVAALITLLWQTLIAPRFVELFSLFGTELPPVSRLLIDLPWLPFVLIAGIAAGVVSFRIARRRLADAIATLAPLTRWRFVAGSGLIGAAGQWRSLVLASALARAGLAPGAAIERVATARDAARLRSIVPALELADSLDLGLHELEHCRSESLAGLAAAIESRRRWINGLLQIAVALVVAVVVIAIYQPIFRIGAVI